MQVLLLVVPKPTVDLGGDYKGSFNLKDLAIRWRRGFVEEIGKILTQFFLSEEVGHNEPRPDACSQWQVSTQSRTLGSRRFRHAD